MGSLLVFHLDLGLFCVLGEVAVEGGPLDPEGLGDLREGSRAFAAGRAACPARQRLHARERTFPA